MKPWVDDHTVLTLVTKVTSPWLIEVDREVLNKDDLMHSVLKWSGGITITGTYVGSIGGSKPDIGHDGDHHMLLHIEFSGVKTPCTSECGKLMSRKDLLQEFTGRESATCNYPSVVDSGEFEREKRTAAGRR